MHKKNGERKKNGKRKKTKWGKKNLLNKPSKVRGFSLFSFPHFVFSFPCLCAVFDSTRKKMGKEKKQNGERKSENSRTFKCHFNTFFFALLFLVEKAHLRQKCWIFTFFFSPLGFFFAQPKVVCQKVVYTGLNNDILYYPRRKFGYNINIIPHIYYYYTLLLLNLYIGCATPFYYSIPYYYFIRQLCPHPTVIPHLTVIRYTGVAWDVTVLFLDVAK